MGKFTKKKTGFLAALLSAVIMLTSLLSACDPTPDYAKDPDTLVIMVWSGGYGSEWVKQIGKAFSDKNTQYTVVVEETTLRETAAIPLIQRSHYDIVISSEGRIPKYASEAQLSGYDTTFADISDVFAHTSEGEDKTIAQKTVPSVMEYNTSLDNKQYYAVVASSLWGITYNKEIMDGYELPRTSDELLELSAQIKSEKNVVPFIFAGDADYWNPIVYTWWAQYETQQVFEKFFEGQSYNEELERYRYSTDIFQQRGRLYALEAAESILSPQSKLCHPDSSGYSYMRAQVDYLQGKAAMMATGGWIENEMGDSFSQADMAKIDYMPVPIISKITEKLTTVKTEAKLREVISYIDDGGTKPLPESKPSNKTEEQWQDAYSADIELVREARSLTYMIGTSLTAAIPSYSSKITLAKEFLKYFFSDEAARIYLETKSGSQLPITTDFTVDNELMAKMSDVDKSRIYYLSQSTVFFNSRKSPIVYAGGLAPFSYKFTMEKAFGSVNERDRISANDYYMYDYNYYTANNGSAWNNLLRNSGLI